MFLFSRSFLRELLCSLRWSNEFRSFNVAVLLVLFTTIGPSGQAVEKFKDSNAKSRSAVQAIIDGTLTTGSVPWMAALVYDGTNSERTVAERQFCGGTLIRANWVLTAGHCVIRRETDEFQVVLGSADLDDPEALMLNVVEIVVHPFFGEGAPGNDIALLRLSENVALTPIKLHGETNSILLSELPATVFGWGRTVEFPDDDICEIEKGTLIDGNDYRCEAIQILPSSNVQVSLLQAPEAIISDYQCEQIYSQLVGGPPFSFPPLGNSNSGSQNICTYDPDETSDTCNGDSGGPLTVKIDGEDRQVGIVNRGTTGLCDSSTNMTVFAKVAYYLDFIDEVIGRDMALGFNNYCPPMPEMEISYENQDDGVVLVTVSWNAEAGVVGYVLRYLDPASDNTLGKVNIDPDTHELSAPLPPGFSALVSIQARGINCDSPLSSVQEIRS